MDRPLLLVAAAMLITSFRCHAGSEAEAPLSQVRQSALSGTSSIWMIMPLMGSEIEPCVIRTRGSADSYAPILHNIPVFVYLLALGQVALL